MNKNVLAFPLPLSQTRRYCFTGIIPYKKGIERQHLLSPFITFANLISIKLAGSASRGIPGMLET